MRTQYQNCKVSDLGEGPLLERIVHKQGEGIHIVPYHLIRLTSVQRIVQEAMEAVPPVRYDCHRHVQYSRNLTSSQAQN
jgi:hypothetical protein